jgi:hypothetical protein
MHRSGTSALAGALGALGPALPAPGDLVTGRYDNPVHNESRALTDLDDAVLAALGGSWSAPPDLAPGWEHAAAAASLAAGAPAAARRAFPSDGPVLWKDPRLCIVLPLWLSVLPPPVVTVFMWRDPLAVARSLRARQGFTLSLGLALWDRYTRDALAALAGRSTYVVSYEDLVREPRASVTAVAQWLGERVALTGGDAAVEAAVSTVSTDRSGRPGDAELPEVIRASVAHLTGLAGAHERFPTTRPEPAPAWMTDTIGQRREYEALYARYMRYVRLKRKIPFLGTRRAP